MKVKAGTDVTRKEKPKAAATLVAVKWTKIQALQRGTEKVSMEREHS